MHVDLEQVNQVCGCAEQWSFWSLLLRPAQPYECDLPIVYRSAHYRQHKD